MPSPTEPAKPSNFLRGIIERDLESGTYAGQQVAGPLDPAMMLSIPPKYAVSQVVGYIKGKQTSYGSWSRRRSEPLWISGRA